MSASTTESVLKIFGSRVFTRILQAQPEQSRARSVWSEVYSTCKQAGTSSSPGRERFTGVTDL